MASTTPTAAQGELAKSNVEDPPKPHSSHNKEHESHDGPPPPDEMNTFVFDVVLWFFTIIMDLFFREIIPRGGWRIPPQGPVLFVAAPHANQFLDPLLLLGIIRKEAHRRVSFLIAAQSMRRKFVGSSARCIGAVSVGRALDLTKPASGRVYLPDPKNDPLRLIGIGTDFTTSQFQNGGLIVLPSVGRNPAANTSIDQIISATEIRLARPFQGDIAMRQLSSTPLAKIKPAGDATETSPLLSSEEQQQQIGSTFKVAPKVDQTKVYNSVFQRLNEGGCIGIFPEGGSHDRTELLPLKAGVAIMALGALAAKPDSDLTITPCGMNYFHAHKFRSRAVVEFGPPVKVPPELVELYKNGNRREAIEKLLAIIYEALANVTVISPDYDTLIFIQAVRRLYNPGSKKTPIPLPLVIELNRRLIKEYSEHQNDDAFVDAKGSNLKGRILEYNEGLKQLNLRDHQLEYAKLPVYTIFGILLYRVSKLLVLSAGVIPGLVLFSPIFILSKRISYMKSKEALAASVVKVQARDVIATWKILVSLALAPVLYTLYTVILAVWNRHNHINGLVPAYVPTWAIIVFGYIFFPAITYAALRFGEVGMDIFKSLRPLVVGLNPASGNALVKLRDMRAGLSHEVTELINTLSPQLMENPDLKNAGHDAAMTRTSWSSANLSNMIRDRFLPRTDSEVKGNRGWSIPASVEDFSNIGDFGMFSTRPTTPSHSRSRTSSTGGIPVSTFASGTNLQTLSGLLREERQERKRGIDSRLLVDPSVDAGSDTGTESEIDSSDDA